MKNKIHMELKKEGYTMRSNINPDCIKAFKRWNKDSAAIIRNAMRHGDCKTIISEMQNAEWRNREIREISEHHDKIIYDTTGKAVYWWDYKEQKTYQLEA